MNWWGFEMVETGERNEVFGLEMCGPSSIARWTPDFGLVGLYLHIGFCFGKERRKEMYLILFQQRQILRGFILSLSGARRTVRSVMCEWEHDPAWLWIQAVDDPLSSEFAN
jgi:hypothetical protein